MEVSGKGAGTSIHANEVRAVETLRNRAMERVTETMVYVLIGHKYSTRRKCCTFQHLALAGPAIPPQRLLRCEDTLPLTKEPRTGNLQDTGHPWSTPSLGMYPFETPRRRTYINYETDLRLAQEPGPACIGPKLSVGKPRYSVERDSAGWNSSRSSNPSTNRPYTAQAPASQRSFPYASGSSVLR